MPAAEDGQLRLLLEAGTPVVTIFGKTWLMHVTEVLRTTAEENLAMIGDSVRFLASQQREVIYDAEHFFDGYFDNPDYALRTLEAAARAGAQFLVLCDTNGGRLVDEIVERDGRGAREVPDSSRSASTRTTIPAWAWRCRSRRCRPGRPWCRAR